MTFSIFGTFVGRLLMAIVMTVLGGLLGSAIVLHMLLADNRLIDAGRHLDLQEHHDISDF